MSSMMEKLAQMESDADRKEFINGLTSSDKYNVRSLAAGWIASKILLRGAGGRR